VLKYENCLASCVVVPSGQENAGLHYWSYS